MTEAAMFADPLRAYVVTLRRGRRISQARLAKSVGISERTYAAWERGETQSIKEHIARAIFDALDGSEEHRKQLDDMRPLEAQQLAQEWLRLPASERDKAQASGKKLARVIELHDDDPREMEDIIKTIRQEAGADPAFLTWLSGFLAGRRGGRPPRE